MSNSDFKCAISLTKLRATIVALLMFILMAPVANATRYITFNDGRLYVFPNNCMLSLAIRDGFIVITDRHGGIYSYSLDDILSIDTELTKELPTFSTYLFDNKYNYQVPTDAVGTITSNAVNVIVSGIGKRLTASFTLSDDAARAYVDGVEQESTVNRLRFEQSRIYTVGYPGDKILTLSDEGEYVMMPFGREYTVNVHFLTDQSTSVPRVYINTVGGVPISSKETYVDAQIIIDGAGVFPSMTDSVKIRGRGNTSWSSNPAAKNPYRLKFSQKVKPFGLTKGKNWVLIANKIYGSMMTNAIGMKAASLVGTPAANHIIPVDLYINGTYKGNYNFTEKVGISNNSVEVADETVAALLELDRYYDEDEGQKFRSNPGDIPVNIKHPEFGEDETLLTFNVIQSRFNAFVEAANNGDDISNYVDIDYLARYMMLNDLICNKEIYHPKSLFCYSENMLDNNSKLIFGPVWDLDWACGYAYDSSSYFNSLVSYDFFNSYYSGLQYQFFSNLGKNRQVSHRMFELWLDFMGDKLDELCEFCQDYYDYAAPSLIKSRTAYPDDLDYAAQAGQASSWLRRRANLIFQRLQPQHLISGDVDGDGTVTINDLTTLIDYLLAGKPNTFIELVGDMNNDGDVNISDLTDLVDLMLHRP